MEPSETERQKAEKKIKVYQKSLQLLASKLTGELGIQSKPGRGTQVTLMAPLKAPPGKNPGKER